MAAKKLFYSWQSDLDKDQNNFFIRDCLKDALKTINKEFDIDLSLDKDTQQTSGSPDIVDTIFRKIRTSNIFVADVTVINSNFNGRKTPNPNVLIELGYAVKAIGWERIICVVNTDVCKPESLPFDIRNNRVSAYSIRRSGIKAAKRNLTETFVAAIKSINDNYSDILKRFSQDNYLQHDKDIFNKLNSICTQVELFNSLDFLCTNLSVNGTYYRQWRNIKSFAEEFENAFLTEEIQEDFQQFVGLLAKLHRFAAQNLFFQDRADTLWTTDYEKKGIEITSEIQWEIDQTHWYKVADFLEVRTDNIEEYEKRLYAIQDEFNRQADEVQEAFKKFRHTLKRHLFI